jgi:colicin import membrane protein
MSRLYQKCFIASGGLHGLLVLILVVCPAFLASKPKQSDVQLITFIPDILTDSPFVGGGNPNAGRPPSPAPPAPPPPTPERAPTPAPPEPPAPVKEIVPPKKTEESLEVSKETKPTKPKREISTTLVVRKPSAKSTAKDTSAEDNQAREQLALRNRIVGALDRSLGNIRSGTGSATRIGGGAEGSYGPGGGGPSYAPYEAWVLTVFDRAWVAPDDATSDDATVEASVTITRDGRVVDKRIVKRSGDRAVDASVQRALDKVTNIGKSFPEGSKDKERTYIIPFNLKTKRGTA